MGKYESRMNNFKFIAACCFLAGCSGDVTVQSREQPDWVIYNASNSPLPDNQVHTIAIDGNDVKWIGTANGLGRFDGVSWSIYDTVNSSLPSNFITSLSISENGNIWIGTNKGLVLYNGSSWTLPEKLKDKFITKLLYDRRNGTLWVGTDQGLCRYNGISWETYDDPETTLLDVYVSSLAVDRNGLLWLGAFDHHNFVGRLLKFNGSKWTSFRLDEKGLPSSFPDALVIDEENIVWLGVKGTMGGMLVRIQEEKWEVFNRANTNCAAMGGGINALTLLGKTKWIATGTGLLNYDGETWNYFNMLNSDIPDDFTTSVEIDRTGRKWTGTIIGGVAVFK